MEPIVADNALLALLQVQCRGVGSGEFRVYRALLRSGTARRMGAYGVGPTLPHDPLSY